MSEIEKDDDPLEINVAEDDKEKLKDKEMSITRLPIKSWKKIKS